KATTSGSTRNRCPSNASTSNLTSTMGYSRCNRSHVIGLSLPLRHPPLLRCYRYAVREHLVYLLFAEIEFLKNAPRMLAQGRHHRLLAFFAADPDMGQNPPGDHVPIGLAHGDERFHA